MTTTRQQEASGNAVPAFLGGIAGFSSYDANASAIATWGIGDDLFPSGCIMSLSPDEAQAFYIFGTATITRSEEHTSELQSLMRISYAVFCLKKKKQKPQLTNTRH